MAQGGPDLTTPNMPGKIKQAIQKSLADDTHAANTRKVIKPGEEPGFLGIPGAPQTNLLLGLIWAIWVGWIFSTVGAFGGIMAGVGHITIFGLADYAKAFGKGNPVNNLLTDSIRVSNQWLVGFSGLISSFNYYRMGRLVAPLGVCLAIGGVGGSWLVPELTAGKISLKAYIGYFGLIVFVLGCFLIYEITPRGAARKKEAKAAAQAFEKAIREKTDTSDQGVKIIEGSYKFMWIAVALVVLSALWINLLNTARWVPYVMVLVAWVLTFMVGTIRFTFFGQEFKFQAWIPMVGGIFIAAIASFLGVGGGFLYVPFLTSVAGLPMFLVAGTSALCVLVGMIVSIFSYMVGKGVVVAWGLIGVELIGIFIGSMIGPRTSKYIPEKVLKIIFIVLAFYVGLRYTTKGFLGHSIVPPF
ncbi:MAG TPA: sulfite exporter TauE/SafE family protein [Desulfobacteraceae bacterium]|nr:sulfite exporter TauE/SafE family protein [Deltaproteobacteria bacterium]MBW2355632.1 sulfite exporter TauE/SafE family protein [Deltaproteobacteria bacterium]RLB98803.1 MAG: sulfite exporter TauE/SafE family protein [Deltaproteobacteria bacterium]HDI60437.1 sulfite exporter TauE/SafE family protein [Desulfobacteraceae bacterium]HDI60442.1 sulfite exporter TauE/SafE family protein [Desulfobacteraceae bacterium]